MATYYVDYTGGLDSNNGQSEGEAWKTWNKVRGETYSAGDFIKFKRGETWNLGDNERWTMDDSGTLGNEITIEDYSSGNKPIWDCEEELQGSSWNNEGSNVWSTAQSNEIKRTRLDGQDSYPATSSGNVDGISYLWHWGSSTLYVYSTQNPNIEYTNIKVSNTSRSALRFQDCSYVTLRNIEMHGGERTVDFRNGSGYDESYVTVEYCDIWYFYQAIIADKDAGGTANYVTIAYNDIDTRLNLISKAVPYGRRGVYDVVRLEENCDDWHIHHNTISNSGHSCLDIRCSASPIQGVNNNIVEYNIFDSSESVYSRAMDVWGGLNKCVDNIYRYNIEKNCCVRSQFGGNGTQLYYNIVYNRVESQATDYSNVSEGFYLDTIDSGVCDGVKVCNNVFYGIHNEAITLSDCDNAIVKNNICVDCGRGGDKLNISIYLSGSLGAGNVIEDNDFYDVGTSDVVNYKGTVETVAEANAGRSEFANNISADPKFVNPGSDDFHLQSDSPCRNAGVDVSLTPDFDGVTVPQETNPAIGAFEFVASGWASEQIAHSDLVGGGLTALHSHTGGGGGADVKSGKVTGLSDGSSTGVTFTTAFSSTPNVVATLNGNIDGDDVAKVYSISTAGFTVAIQKIHGGSGHTWDVEWIATDAGNS